MDWKPMHDAWVGPLPDGAIDAATAAQLRKVTRVVRSASARIHEILVAADVRIGVTERRKLEKAARDLRYAIASLEQQPGRFAIRIE